MCLFSRKRVLLSLESNERERVCAVLTIQQKLSKPQFFIKVRFIA